jgi:hypothetical protein
MAQISKLSRLVAGLQRQVDLTANTLVVQDIQLGGLSGTVLTQTILDKLIPLQNGTDFATGTNSHTHDGRYFTEAELGSASASSGSDLIGDDNTYSNFTPSAATVKGALAGIDAALTAGNGQVKITASDTTAQYLGASIIAGSALTSTVLNPGVNETLSLDVAVDDSTIEVSADALRVKDLGITAAKLAADSVITAKILDSNVTAAKLATDSVTTIKIVDANVTNVKIATGIDAAKLADGSVSNAEFQYINSLTSNAQTQLTDNATAISDHLSDASDAHDASAISSVAAGNLASTDVQAALNELDGDKVAKSGDTMSGNLAMGSNKITGLGAGSNPGDAVNKAQLDAVSAGALWINPIIDPNLVHDTLATPPGSPVIGDTYIAGATATGAWATFDGYAFMWDGSAWVDLLGRAVIAGDRFGVSMESATAGAGGLASQNDKIATVVSPTPGSVSYTFYTPIVSNAVYVNNALSYHTGHQYDYTGSGWVEFGGLNAVSAGNGLTYAGNVLSVNMGAGIATMPSDEVGVDVHTSGGLMTTVDNSSSSTLTNAQLAVKLDGSTLSKSASGLKVATGGITNTEVNASAAIAYSKLALSNSIVAGDLTSNSVTTAKIAAAAVDETKLATSVAGDGLTGGAGSPLKIKIYGDTNLDGYANGLGVDANGLYIGYDDTTIGVAGNVEAGSLEVKDLGITTAKLANNAVTTAKILNANVTLAKMASDSVDENKIISSALNSGGGLTGGSGTKLAVQTDTITIDISGNQLHVVSGGITEDHINSSSHDSSLYGGSGQKLSVLSSPAGVKVVTQGEAMANTTTSFAVRMYLASDGGGSAAGRVHKADKNAATEDKFYVVGLGIPQGTSAGNDFTLTFAGSHTLGASNSAFASGDVGKAVYLTSAGGFSVTPPSAADEAIFRIGVVETTTSVWVGGMQLNGIN